MNWRSFAAFLIWVSLREFLLVCGQESHADTAVLDPSLSDVKFTTNVLFERDGVSKPRCAGLCMRTPHCSTFTCTQTEGRLCQCRGYCGLKKISDPHDVRPGTKAYVVHVEVDGCLITQCSANTDCTVPNSRCRFGRCTCIHGYYYSVGAKVCQEDCPPADLQDTYLRYENCTLWNYNYADYYDVTLEECKSQCDGDGACLHYEYGATSGDCYTSHDNTRLLTSADGWEDPFIHSGAYSHYQRNCA